MFYKIIVSIAFLLASTQPTRAVTDPKAPTTPTVLVEKVATVELADEITYPARVSSKVNAAINSDLDGIVSKISTPLGSKVGARAAMFTIKNTDPVYEYVPVTIFSPVAGIVSSIEIAQGSMVKKGQQIATITDPSQLRVLVEVASTDLPKLKKGMSGQMVIGNNAAKPIEVIIEGISPLVDPGTGTATAELKPIIKDHHLPVGVIGRVSFTTNKRKGIQIPEQALLLRGANTLVRVIEKKDDKSLIRVMNVKVESTRRGMVEITSGINPGDTIVTRTSSYISDGQEVKVEEGGTPKQ